MVSARVGDCAPGVWEKRKLPDISNVRYHRCKKTTGSIKVKNDFFIEDSSPP